MSHKILQIALAAAAIASIAAPAFADDWHHHRREVHRHDYRPGYAPYYRRGYVYAPPPVVYAPPPVAYAPPPVVYGGPSVNFVLPLHIR